MSFSNFMIWWKGIIVLIFISKGIWPSVFSSIFLPEDNDDDQLYTIITWHYSRMQAQVQTFFRNCSLLKFLLRKDKNWFISSFNTKCLLGYMIIDHIALTTTRKVSFLLFSMLIKIVLCLENCSCVWKIALEWHEEVLACICVFWGDSGMTSEGNFNVYLCTSFSF